MSEMMNELESWLETQKGSSIRIRKEERLTGKQEIFDIDEIKLQLDTISIREIEAPDPDDYLSNQELVLRGEGSIYSDQGKERLPQDTYEIPLDSKVVTRKEGTGYIVETETAIYHIHPQ